MSPMGSSKRWGVLATALVLAGAGAWPAAAQDFGDFAAPPPERPVAPKPPAKPPSRPVAAPAPSKPKPRPAGGSSGMAPPMVRISGGCFEMGSPSWEQGRDDDERQHRVCVEDFKIGRYEVTQSQWASVMGSNPSYFSGCANCPVEQVSWHEVQDYLGKLNARTGGGYRLPTEAEWEYGARAGSTTAYPWGDGVGRNRANCAGCGSEWDGKRTAPVGSFAPNAWGLYDTVGNVWEWTCSVYDADYGGAERRCASKNDAGSRALRGGSWYYLPAGVRAASRHWLTPGSRDGDLGFRLAQD